MRTDRPSARATISLAQPDPPLSSSPGRSSVGSTGYGDPLEERMTARWRSLAGWRLMAELARRNPDRWLVETHPGGGQYDCLEFVPGSGPIVNLAGSIHVAPGEHWPGDAWG